MSTKTSVSDFVRERAKFDPWGKSREASEDVKALAAQLDQEARDNWDSPEWRRQVAADLADVVDYGFTSASLFAGYIQTETVGEFDRVYIREQRGLKVFSTSRGGYIDESQMRDETFEVPRDTLGFHVSEHTDKLRAGFSRTIADLSDKGGQRMDAEVNRRLITLMQTAMPNPSTSYVGVSGLTKANLDAAIRDVQDAIKPDGTGPVPVTILGRAAMLDAIQDFPGYTYQPIYSDAALEEIRARGFLGTYKGASMVKIINYGDEDGNAYTNANELWVLGGNAGKFVFYGGLQVKMWDENTVDVTHMRARRDVGGLISHPEVCRRIVDSTVTP